MFPKKFHRVLSLLPFRTLNIDVFKTIIGVKEKKVNNFQTTNYPKKWILSKSIVALVLPHVSWRFPPMS